TVDSEGKPICTSGAPSINMNCTSIHTTDTWVTHTSTHTSTMTKTSTITSKVTIVSTKKCQPTQCTTDRTHPTHGSGGEEAGDVKPSGGMRIHGWGTIVLINICKLMRLFLLSSTPQSTLPKRCRADIDLGREGVQMLKKRDQGGMEAMEEDHFLAFILKEKVKSNCETELEKYCKSLKNAGLKSQEIHENLIDVCEDENGKPKENKCERLKNKIEDKCREFKKKLDELQDDNYTEKKCEEYESRCHFLEGACSNDLTEKCSELRNKCYLIRRVKVAEEVLLRALKGGLKEKENQCEKKLKEECKTLSVFSKELMQLCLDSKETCENLEKEAENKCDSLKKNVEKIEKDKCHSLLEQCHFYGPNCEEETKTNCDKLKKKCDEDYDILYTPPEEPWFPIQPGVSIIEKVGLKELYKAIAKEGILINKLQLPSMEDLIFFLSQKEGNRDFDEEECKKINKEQCDYLKTLSRDSDYKCDGLENKCTELEGKFEQRRKALKKEIKNLGLLNENNRGENAGTISWHKLYSDFYGRRCARLESECFYLDKNDKSDFEKACKNVRNMCYKRGVDAVTYERLESQMHGKFQDLGPNWVENGLYQCQKKLVEVCNGVRNQSYHFLALCLHPEKTCDILILDIREKARELNNILDITRDFPEEDHCLELEPKCVRLIEEDAELLGPCHTLERNCRHLKELGEIERILLDEKKDHFQAIENCTTELDKQCDRWSRKVHKPFGLSCALQSDSCERMTFNVYRYCENLIRNINESEIVNTLKGAKNEIEKLKELCPTWLPFCNQLSSTCPEEVNQDGLNISFCQEIQTYCEPYKTREALENKVMYEFRGNLTNRDQCMFKLESYCVFWEKMDNNTYNSLVSLCKDTSSNSNKNDTQVKKELCERLVYRVKKLCKKLPIKLEKKNEELTERIKIYNDLKKKAEEASNTTNVILTFNIENNSTNKTNTTTSHALVKRSQTHPTITEKEAEAFDLVAMVITEYVELKEKCKKLLLDCGFKECKGSEDPCKKINKACTDLKPLEMRPPQTITKTITTETTAETGAGGKSCSKTVTLSGNMTCGSVDTTDIWVTHTSTHTSTKTQTSTVISKVTIVSTKKCQPTQCTTDRTHPIHTSGGEEAGEVKPSGGIRVNGWGAKGRWIDTPSFNSWRVDIDLGREGVQMLKKRDQEGKGEVIGEDELLALILKEHAINGDCQEKLSEYCESLKKINSKSKDIHKNLKDVCEEEKAEEKKCKGLKEKIKKKCTEFKEKLEKALGKIFIEENCAKYEPECHFLEGACPTELKGKCSELRNECYGLKREKVAKEVLLRALKGSLKEGNKECKDKLEEECKRLNGFSKELMRLCLHSEGTCESLKKAAKEKCTSFEAEVKEAIEKLEKNKCYSLLEECHFYGPNCEETKDIKTKCDKLKTQCEDEHNTVYTPPEEPWIPIQPMPDITDKVGLEELYNEATKSGLLIEGLHTNMEDLMLFLSQKEDGDFDQKKCQEAHETKRCNYLKGLSGDSDYNCTNIEECERLEDELQQKRDNLEEHIQEINLLKENNGPGRAETIPWHKLNPDLNGRNCAELQSDCFFLDRYHISLGIACDNVKSMCYKRGLDAAAYDVLENKMRGMFRDLGENWSKKCQKKLIEVCNGVRNQSYHLLALCLHPKKTCYILKRDIEEKSSQLRDILEFIRDYPHEEDCIKFQSKCNALKQDNPRLSEPCHTLEKNCRHLKELGEIKSILLDEKRNLKNVDDCIPELNQQCNHWSRKVHKPF
ncbi:hypothetical protein PCANB_001949, partial [Pneumocystis canis]